MNHTIKNLFLLFIFFSSYAISININANSVISNKVKNQNSENTIQGYVFKSDSRIPLSGANVILKSKDGSDYGSSSDKDGFFFIKTISPGDYEIFITFIGYEDYSETVKIEINNTYNLEVNSYGPGGSMTSGSISVEVLVTFEPPPELVAALTTGSWRVQAEESGYLGVGPLDSDTDNWYSAPPYTHSATAMFDDRYIFSPINSITGTGDFSVQAFGGIFGKAPPLSADFTGDQGLTPNAYDEFEYYPVDDYTASWYISAPGDVLHINFTGNGFLGFYVGGGLSYEILSWDSTSIHARTVGYDNLRWYIKITNDL